MCDDMSELVFNIERVEDGEGWDRRMGSYGIWNILYTFLLVSGCVYMNWIVPLSSSPDPKQQSSKSEVDHKMLPQTPGQAVQILW